MTPDIERLAKEAGLLPDNSHPSPETRDMRKKSAAVQRFADRLIEECAKLVEPGAEHRKDASWGYLGGDEGVVLLDRVAKTIRAKFARGDLKDAAK